MIINIFDIGQFKRTLVHNLDRNCDRLPLAHNQVALGVHANCHGALLATKSYYSNVDVTIVPMNITQQKFTKS